MGDIYMTRTMGSTLVKFAILILLLFLALIGYVLWQSYEGRVDLVTSSRRACERSKLDRNSNAKGWRTAQQAREASLAQEMHISEEAVTKLIKADPSPTDQSDLVAARRYDRIAGDLEQRSRLICTKVVPDPSFFP